MGLLRYWILVSKQAAESSWDIVVGQPVWVVIIFFLIQSLVLGWKSLGELSREEWRGVMSKLLSSWREYIRKAALAAFLTFAVVFMVSLIKIPYEREKALFDQIKVAAAPHWIEDLNYSSSGGSFSAAGVFYQARITIFTPITIRPVLIRIECARPVDRNKLTVPGSILVGLHAEVQEDRIVEITAEAAMPPAEPLSVEITSRNEADAVQIIRVMRWGTK